jgi:hypothetical protein
MSFKGDIQATRFNAATSNVIIAPAVRLRGIIIAGAGNIRYCCFKKLQVQLEQLYFKAMFQLET